MADKYNNLCEKIARICQGIKPKHCELLAMCYFEDAKFIPRVDDWGILTKVNMVKIRKAHAMLDGKHQDMLGDFYESIQEGYFGLEEIYKRSNMAMVAKLTGNFTYGSPGGFVRLVDKMNRKRLNMALHAAAIFTPSISIVIPLAKKFVRPTHRRDYKFLYHYMDFATMEPEDVYALAIILRSIPVPEAVRKQLCKSFFRSYQEYTLDQMGAELLFISFNLSTDFLAQCQEKRIQRQKDFDDKLKSLQEQADEIFVQVKLD